MRGEGRGRDRGVVDVDNDKAIGGNKDNHHPKQKLTNNGGNGRLRDERRWCDDRWRWKGGGDATRGQDICSQETSSGTRAGGVRHQQMMGSGDDDDGRWHNTQQ